MKPIRSFSPPRLGTALSRSAGLALSAGALLLAGCSTSLLPAPQPDRTQYYVLTGPAAPERPAEGAHLRIALGGITLPEYLRGRAIVVRRGANELALDDFQRWGESLQSGLERTLRLDLLAQAGVSDVSVPPSPLGIEPGFLVSIDVIRCEGEVGPAGGRARFAALYRIERIGEVRREIARREFIAPDAAWDGHDYGRLAALLSDDIAALAREIAGALPQ
jgi:uncharacterized lipoprotein YmbA